MPRNSKSTPNIRETLSAEKVGSAIDQLIAHLSKSYDFSSGNVALVGVHTRGAILAKRIAQQLETKTSTKIPVGAIDITLYRDDFGTAGLQPEIGETQINFEIDEKQVVLIDDVLFTGRTVRAAIDEIMDFGRPRSISLVVLVDRGHRELPIQADFAALRFATKRSESVNLQLQEVDQKEGIVIYEAAS